MKLKVKLVEIQQDSNQKLRIRKTDTLCLGFIEKKFFNQIGKIEVQKGHNFREGDLLELSIKKVKQ